MITYSAIKFFYNKYPIIICGKRHSDCLVIAAQLFGLNEWKKIKGTQNIEQGFVTDHNQFLNRQDAATYAYEQKQLNVWKKELFSEDLW